MIATVITYITYVVICLIALAIGIGAVVGFVETVIDLLK